MRLTDLNPQWLDSGGEGVSNADDTPAPERHGIAVGFDCPCGNGERVCIMLRNPLDGGPALLDGRPSWERTGDTFETLKLAPSIQRADPNGCRWHGFIGKDIPGEVTTA